MTTQRTALALALALAAPAARAQAVALTHATSLYADAADAPLRAPEGVACADGGPLVVADTGNGRLVLFPYKDGVVGAGSERVVPELPHPVRVQVGEGGEILVLDRKLRRIGRVGADGKFLGYLDVKRDPPVVPAAFRAVRGGALVVLDLAAPAVLQVDRSGAIARQVALPAGAGPFTDVAVGPTGALLALDPVGGAVWSASPGDAAFKPLAKGLAAFTSFGGYLAADGKGKLFLVDQNGSGLVVLGQDGAYLGRQLGFGWKEGLLQYPAQIAIARDADLFVADRQNNRVQMFSIVR